MAENKRLRSPSVQPMSFFAFFSYSSPFGLLWIAHFSSFICHISLIDDREGFLNFLRKKTGHFPRYQLSETICQSLDRYFKKDRTALEELDTVFLWGTDFQKKVWRTLRDIPYGQTRTYAWLAEKVNLPKGCRAVGAANSANPIPLIFPCHRVIKTDGGLGGFMGSHPRGKKIKSLLLNLEKGIDME